MKLDYWQRLLLLFDTPIAGKDIVENIFKLPNNQMTKRDLSLRLIYRLMRSLLYDQLLVYNG